MDDKPSRSDLGLMAQAASNGWITDAEQLRKLADAAIEIAKDVGAKNGNVREQIAAIKAATSSIKAAASLDDGEPEATVRDLDLSLLDDHDLGHLERIAAKLAGVVPPGGG